MAEPQQEKYQPLALIAVVLAALLLFALFFLGFLVAPLAILTIFYVGFAASDRSKRSNDSAPPPAAEPVVVPEPAYGPEDRLAQDAAARRAGVERTPTAP